MNYTGDKMQAEWTVKYDDATMKTFKKSVVGTSFKKGDIVRLKNGTQPIRLLEHWYKGAWYGKYMKSGKNKNVKESNIVHYEEALQETKEKGKEMTKLYETKDGKFGTHLATNSEGKFVLEMKSTNEVIAFDKDDLVEVKPYTVGVKFSNTPTIYHFLAKKGQVAKGDILIMDNYVDFAKVTDVDTKSDKATKDLVGRKIMTEEI